MFRTMHIMPWNNLRYAGRQLRKSPAFTVTVLATLALCIGANTAIYTIVDTLFFRALPYRDPTRLVMISSVTVEKGASDIETGQTGLEWETVRDHASFLDSAVFGSISGVNLFSGGRVEYVQQQRVSANFFHVLGVAPLIGREFTPQEDIVNGPPVVILSYAVWRRVFHADPSIVGRTIDLRGAPHTVVGVLPASLNTLPTRAFASLHEPPDVWTPLQPSRSGEGSGINYGIIARLKPGVTFAQANGQLASIMRANIAEMHLPSNVSMQEKAIPLQVGLANDVRSKVNLMWGAVLLVLVIGCVNIAGILLARSASRSREIATRMAIGASRARIVSELLVEALLLAFLGGLLGLGLGQLALNALIYLSPDQFSVVGPVHLDIRVMIIMLAISLATSILFGLFPAFDATASGTLGTDLRSALSEGGRGSAGGRRQWKRQALVFAEVALGVVLVVGAGLLIRTFAILMNANPGFDPNHVMTASLSLQDARYNTARAGAKLFHESIERIQRIPGVESAAVALSPPYGRALNEGVSHISGGPVTQEYQITNFTYATPDFFKVLRINLLRGRLFTDADNANAAGVAVVNQAFVGLYLRNRPDPLGTLIRIENKDWRIIGVVNNVQEQNGWGGKWGPIDEFAEVYVPADQFPDGIFAMANVWFSPVWLVRTHGNIQGLPDAMRHALASVDPRLPFSSFQSMTQVRGESLSDQRYQATLFSVLAGLALFLAALGIYGLIAQSVAQRTREMGIRLALGATAQGVVRTAIGPGITLAIGGVGCGVVLALFATRVLKSLIWGVAPTDPTTFLLVALLLITVAGISSVIPALQLARLDPAQTLRHE